MMENQIARAQSAKRRPPNTSSKRKRWDMTAQSSREPLSDRSRATSGKGTARIEGHAEGRAPRQPKPELERYRLQVDGQIKSSFAVSEPAHAAGSAVKKRFPIVRVTVHDAVNGETTVIS